MGLLDFLYKNVETSADQQGSKEYDLRDHPNALKLADIKSDKAKKLIVELKLTTQQLTQKNIQLWRNAHQTALNIENPKRYELYNIYDDAMLDLHLKGAVRNRKLKVIGSPFKIVNADGIENPGLTKMLQTSWFKNFMSLSLDAKFWGHSLIQFDDIIREGKLRFKKTRIVPRRHVCPEYEVLLKEITDEPKKGFAYNKPPYNIWTISVGDNYDLGELLAVSKETISKKFVLQFWDQFAEMFGMPLRIGKTSSRNQDDITKIENMLEDMGSASWGVFPDGTTVEVVESKRGDAFNVYDKRIERANSEISKAVLGQTMTMDDGSSRSQAVVHADVADEIAEADADFLKDVTNDDLFPFLRMHGFPIAETDEFTWDETYEYTPKEMKEIEDMLLDDYDIDPKYFEEKYQIPIIGKKQTQSTTTEVEDKKKRINLIARDPEFVLCCDDDHQEVGLLTLAATTSKLDKASDDLIRFVWDNPEASYSLDYFNFLSQIYIDGLVRGWSQQKALKLAYKSFANLNIDYDATDWQTLQMMEVNLFRFSASKDLGVINQLNQLLPDSKTFSDFKKKASKLLKIENVNHLRTEYKHAWGASRSAAEYHRLIKVKDDFPTWIYMTAGDDKVRAAHKALHGKMFKAGDPAFDSIDPPNGYGCRCYKKGSTKVLPDDQYTTKDQAIKLLQESGVDKNGVSEWDRMVKGRFNRNWAKTKTIFDENKFYVKEDLLNKMGIKDMGATPFGKMTDLPKLTLKENSIDEAMNFYKILVKKPILDYNKRVIEFSEKTVKNHLTKKYIEKGFKGRQNTIELIPDVIGNPDEVWLFEDNRSGKFYFRYLKYWDGKPFNVVVKLTDSSTELISWYDVDINKIDRNIRNGILIKNNL